MRRIHPHAPKPQWILKPQPDAAALQKLNDYPPQLATLLWQRGIKTSEQAQKFLAPEFSQHADPRTLTDMTKAVARFTRALKADERIFIAGDLDHDGICGTALLSRFFADVGVAHEGYMPSEEEGHELGDKAIARAQKFGATVLFAVDFGVSSGATINKAQRKGIDVVVLDHHVLPRDPPDAYAIVDPRRSGTAEALSFLCGAGVAFAFVDACVRGGIYPSFVQDTQTYLRDFLDLVAMATIGDLVPLLGDNRTLVREGLAVLGERKRPGTAALCAASRLKETIGEDDVAFSLVPRLNAASRMGSTSLAYELLRAPSQKNAEVLARKINRANAARQKTMREVTEKALAKVAQEGEVPWVIVVGDPAWPMPFLGLVASRLKDRYHRPVFAWARHPAGFLRMSGRSVEAFDLVEAMRECGGESFFIKFGGHPQAAGCDVPAARMAEFEQCMKTRGRKILSPKDLTPTLWIDLALEPQEMGVELSRSFEPLAPFGKGNPRPSILVRGLRVAATQGALHGLFGRISFTPKHGGRSFTAFVEQDHPAFRLRQGDLVDAVFEYARLFGMSASRTPVPLLVDANLH